MKRQFETPPRPETDVEEDTHAQAIVAEQRHARAEMSPAELDAALVETHAAHLARKTEACCPRMAAVGKLGPCYLCRESTRRAKVTVRQ